MTPSCLRDLAQIFRRALEMLRRCARNDFQVRHLGQAREDFVLDAFAKIGVRLVVAQVVEWQDGDALVGNGGGRDGGSLRRL